MKEVGGSYMDMAELSMVMSQSRVKESAGISVMKMAMDTSKETASQMTEMMSNVAIDTNIGQHLDVSA